MALKIESGGGGGRLLSTDSMKLVEHVGVLVRSLTK